MEGLISFFPFILIILVFYFLLWRPEKKKRQEREVMLSNLGKNDTVMTTGGIFGVVKNLDEKSVTLLVDDSNGVRVKVARSAIQTIVKESGKDAGGE